MGRQINKAAARKVNNKKISGLQQKVDTYFISVSNLNFTIVRPREILVQMLELLTTYVYSVYSLETI